jgi:hypothetical protein
MPLLGSRGAASLTGFGGLAKLGYLLRNSLRFRASADAYLSRTPASAGNQQTWTWSGWVKRGVLGSASTLISGGGTTGRLALFFNGSDQLEIDVGGTGSFQTSTAVFRDPAAWYHVVWAFDTTQGTGANRSRIYVNGTELSLTQTRTFTQNTDYAINGTGIQTHGTLSNSIGGYNFDGYLTEMNFVNAQQLTPSSFAKTDPVTGQWIPIKFGGVYGTNGFYLNFTDASAATAAAIGKDSSGNGNNWTPNNISVTAGATYDSMTDVPTLTSATAANYATLNPLTPPLDGTLSNGNLNVSYGSATNRRGITATMGMVTGKFYWEVTIVASSSNPCDANIGITNTTDNWSGNSTGIGLYVGYTADGWGIYGSDGTKYNNGSGTAYGASFTTNDVIGVAFDADTRTLTFYKQTGGTGSFVSQGVAYTGLAATTYFPAISDGGGGSTITMAINFGQRPFNNTSLPSGYKALNTFNI